MTIHLRYKCTTSRISEGIRSYQLYKHRAIIITKLRSHGTKSESETSHHLPPVKLIQNSTNYRYQSLYILQIFIFHILQQFQYLYVHKFEKYFMTFRKCIHLTTQFCSNMLCLFIYAHLIMVSRSKHVV
jgi:hypothetical protein